MIVVGALYGSFEFFWHSNTNAVSKSLYSFDGIASNQAAFSKWPKNADQVQNVRVLFGSFRVSILCSNSRISSSSQSSSSLIMQLLPSPQARQEYHQFPMTLVPTLDAATVRVTNIDGQWPSSPQLCSSSGSSVFSSPFAQPADAKTNGLLLPATRCGLTWGPTLHWLIASVAAPC